jgi:uncharacterized membrane protein
LKNFGEDMQDLGTPEGGYGEAYSINDVGQVVANIWYAGDWYAALWEDGLYYLLNDVTVNLPPGVHLTEARCINAQGWIVGCALIDYIYSRAFLLTPAAGYVPMGLLLD